MLSEKCIAKEIFKDLVFTEDETAIIKSLFHKVTVQKGTILINTGNTINEEYYILEGCLRSFHVDKHGKEHTIQFGIKDWWISDYIAYFSSSKTILTIEVIQDAILYKINARDKELLCNKVPQTERFFRLKLERAYASFLKRILTNLSLSAKERYHNFILAYPNIEKNIKNYHIASYLGITTESLSRIRKDI